MKLESPSFWYGTSGVAARTGWVSYALLPLSCLYRAIKVCHQLTRRPQRAPVPVICVGNINIGGTGKTPTVIAVMDVVRKMGLAHNPAFLLRGYGGSLKGPLRVESGRYNPAHIGEEALLLAKSGAAATYISANRHAGALYAAREGVDFIVMDDGLQNRSLSSDVRLIVVNGAMGFGNGHVFPAGPLRENIRDGLKKAHAVILIGEDIRGVSRIIEDAGVPIIRASVHTAPSDIPPHDKQYLAFAGIGYPQKFYDYARDDLRLAVSETHNFGDHHDYSAADIEMLREKAAALGLALLTTEKDMLKIRSLYGTEVNDIYTLPISLQFEQSGEALLAALLKGAVRS